MEGVITSEQPVHLHIPTPGDQYSPATGSAVMTLIYQVARCHQAAGGDTEIVVSRGTKHDYPVGRCLEVAATRPPRKWQKAVDLIMGRLGLPRAFGEAPYAPAAAAIPVESRALIFVHNSPAPLRLFRSRFPNAKLCLWLNNDLFRTYSRAEIERVEEAVDRFICCSHYIAGTIERRLRRISRKVCVVHNGADTDAFKPRPPTDRRGPPVILFVGRVQPIKGPDLLIRAAINLAASGHEFLLRIVGSAGFSATDPLTPYEMELRSCARPLGDKVEFVPFTDRSRIPREFESADIFTVPSNWNDPCPLTVAEGMASGLPMVVARKGGIPEVGGDAVRYFDPPNVDEIVVHLSELLRFPEIRRDLGRKARARAELFSYGAQYLKLMGALGE